MKKISLFIICLIFALVLSAGICLEARGLTEYTAGAGKDTYTENTDDNNLLEDTGDAVDTEEDNGDGSAAQCVTYIRSDTGGLRLRVRPDASAATLGYMDADDMALYLGAANGWYKTVYKETEAYVSSDYCSKVSVAAGDDKTEKTMSFAATLLGYPYVWGSERYHWGNGVLNTNFVNGKFDCSAFTQYVYYISNGVVLGTTTRTQVLQGKEIGNDDIRRGDLMFFTNSSRYYNSGIERVGHVGIYLGDNYILHTSSDHAVIEPISSTRWSYFITARRVM